MQVTGCRLPVTGPLMPAFPPMFGLPGILVTWELETGAWHLSRLILIKQVIYHYIEEPEHIGGGGGNKGY